MDNIYRKLTEEELLNLKNNGCSCDNWNDIYVRKGFNTEYVRNSRFSGIVRLGVFENSFEFKGGVKKHSGIFRSVLHNCTVEDNVLIENVSGYIANYHIHENVLIENVNTIAVTEETSFGNGVKVSVLDETGGRQVIISDKLSSHFAYILALYKYMPDLTMQMEKMAEKYADEQKSLCGTIGKNSIIKNTQTIKNVRFGSHTSVDGVTLLENGSVNGNKQAPVFIGQNVTARDFIVNSGSSVYNAATLNRCYIGQACKIGNGYFATDSLFFSNCHLENGEACSIFAGPYTVSHHKSTLLIGGMFSFYNAGSGTNQSNHMYKLGPIHHGIMERGCKTASSSYLMWPAHIGPYSVVLGKHSVHFDTSELPFSYLMEKNGNSYILPAINLQTAGTARDISKWPTRDERKDSEKIDFINLTFLNPYIIEKIIEGLKVLENLRTEQGEKDFYIYNKCLISNSALNKGIILYKIAAEKYLGEILINRLNDNQSIDADIPLNFEGWADISGIIVPKSELKDLLSQMENRKLKDVISIHIAFEKLNQAFRTFEWNWVYGLFVHLYNLKKINRSEVFSRILDDWFSSSVKLDQMILEDAKKEWNSDSIICFGMDGSEENRLEDIKAVKGRFEVNPFVKQIQERMKSYEVTFKHAKEILESRTL